MIYIPILAKTRLFSTDDFSKDKELYIQFYDELNNNKPISSYPELEQYRRNIKYLLNQYSVSDPIRSDYFCWSAYVDQVVDLSKRLGNIIVNPDMYVKLRLPDRELSDLDKLSLIESIYIPKQKTYFEAYINDCFLIYRWFILRKDLIRSANFENDEINEFMDYLIGYCYTEKGFDALKNNQEMISLIFGYIHYHGIKNYDLIAKFISDVDYYIEKMKMNDCLIYKENNYLPFDVFDVEKAHILFNNLESFLNKEKEIIR